MTTKTALVGGADKTDNQASKGSGGRHLTREHDRAVIYLHATPLPWGSPRKTFSIETQRAIAHQHALGEGYRIVSECVEHDAGNEAEWPKLREQLRKLEDGDIDGIFIRSAFSTHAESMVRSSSNT